jgi:hypothetical protein
MPRTPKTPGGKDLLDSKVSEVTALIKALSPQARVEVSFERHEDEDAHIRVYPPASVDSQEAARIELILGERCNEVLLETGLFIIGSICD